MWSALVARGLSQLGILTIVPDYRNFPQGDIRDMMLDIRMAVEWTECNAHRFGGNPNKIILAGQSAGAHICLCTLVEDFFRKKSSQKRTSTKHSFQPKTSIESKHLSRPSMQPSIFDDNGIGIYSSDNKSTTLSNGTLKELDLNDQRENSPAPLKCIPTVVSPQKRRIPELPGEEDDNYSLMDTFSLHSEKTESDKHSVITDDPEDRFFDAQSQPVHLQGPSPTQKIHEGEYQTPETIEDSEELMNFGTSNRSNNDNSSSSSSSIRSSSEEEKVDEDLEKDLENIYKESGIEAQIEMEIKKSEESFFTDSSIFKAVNAFLGFSESIDPSCESIDASNSPAIKCSDPTTQTPSLEDEEGIVWRDVDSPNTTRKMFPRKFLSEEKVQHREGGLYSGQINQFDVMSKIKLFIGVSGPYNLHALESHLHGRGLDSSILKWICHGDISRYSPTMRLNEYINKNIQEEISSFYNDDDDFGVHATVGQGDTPHTFNLGGKYPVSSDFLSDFPPVALFHGSRDASIPLSICAELTSTLRDNGAEVLCKVYEGWSHTDAILEGPLSGSNRLFKDMISSIYSHTEFPYRGRASTFHGLNSQQQEQSSIINKGLISKFNAYKERLKNKKYAPKPKKHPLNEPMVPKLLVEIARIVNPF